jgi:hypothetical protein
MYRGFSPKNEGGGVVGMKGLELELELKQISY